MEDTAGRAKESIIVVGERSVFGVELFVQIRHSLLGESEQAIVDVLNEAVFFEITESLASVLSANIDSGNHSIARNCFGSHIAHIAKALENGVIGWTHPAGALSHLFCAVCVSDTHMNADTYPNGIQWQKYVCRWHHGGANGVKLCASRTHWNMEVATP
ncbi:hypothetical protein [Halomarina rubra]|uniref:Uncharacterized protein n=1 Tax=Halomarina rubra TaxID=2071873 RepID=A0ABD6AZ73_9EURY|nr:hypothetical protein [Halomarina rubra]